MNAPATTIPHDLRALFPTEPDEKLAVRAKLLTYRNGASLALGRFYGADHRLRDLHRAILETAAETATAPIELAELKIAREACALMAQATLRLEALWGGA